MDVGDDNKFLRISDVVDEGIKVFFDFDGGDLYFAQIVEHVDGKRNLVLLMCAR